MAFNLIKLLDYVSCHWLSQMPITKSSVMIYHRGASLRSSKLKMWSRKPMTSTGHHFYQGHIYILLYIYLVPMTSTIYLPIWCTYCLSFLLSQRYNRQQNNSNQSSIAIVTRNHHLVHSHHQKSILRKWIPWLLLVAFTPTGSLYNCIT